MATQRVTLLVAMLTAYFRVITPSIVSPPLNVVAAVGSDVIFPCVSDDVGVRWDYYQSARSGPTVIYTGSKVNQQITSRITVRNQSSDTGRYDLLIQSVEQSDAGDYVCFHSSWPTKYAASLTVIELGLKPCSTNLSLSSETGRYEADQAAYFEFRCAVNYSGSWVPSLRCKSLGIPVDAKPSIDSSSNSVSYTLRARAPSNMESETFECGVVDNGRHGNNACGDGCIMANNVPNFYRQLELFNVTFFPARLSTSGTETTRRHVEATYTLIRAPAVADGGVGAPTSAAPTGASADILDTTLTSILQTNLREATARPTVDDLSLLSARPSETNLSNIVTIVVAVVLIVVIAIMAILLAALLLHIKRRPIDTDIDFRVSSNRNNATTNDCSRHIDMTTTNMPPQFSSNHPHHQYTVVCGTMGRSGGSPVYDEIGPRHSFPRFQAPPCPSMKLQSATVPGLRQNTADDLNGLVSSIYINPMQCNDDEHAKRQPVFVRYMTEDGELVMIRGSDLPAGMMYVPVSNVDPPCYETTAGTSRCQPTVARSPRTYATLTAPALDYDVTRNRAVSSGTVEVRLDESDQPPIYCVSETYANFGSEGSK